MKTTGTKIAEVRRKAGKTQAEIADILDVSFQAVSAWERDEYLPDTENLIKLARLLEVSIPSLVEDSKYEFETKKEIFDWRHMKTFIKTTAKNLNMVNTQKALDFAVTVHEGQFRKNSDIPYISHPLTLACHCLAMGITDDETVAVCLLHDVVEDCGVKAEDLPVDKETRKLVVLLTHEKDAKENEKVLKAYYKGIVTEPKACLVKCLDRCNNLTTMSWGLEREKQFRNIKETEKYVLPLLDVVKNDTEFNNAAWLLRYQIESMLDIYKRTL